jgi:WD40 repeat protein/tRNA A-37 threonylcarbamoyl transferase component Bud32
MAESAAPASVGELTGRTLGHFAIHEKIGEGGFGSVYRARQSLLDRPAVVKVLHTRLRTTAVMTERFLREAKLASRLDHPYAAHIYAFGAEDDGMLWLAMELVRGTTLSEYLEANGPLPLERFVPLLERICEVVHTAHEQGIVHRDIKPANVMVVSRAGRLLPKLLDFGIAKALTDESPAARAHAPTGPLQPVPDVSVEWDPGADTATPDPDSDGALTQRGAVIGSPHYMAPEQWVDAAAVDGRTDLYALGIMAYEALTGAPPFKGKSVFELARAHAQGVVPPVPEPLPRALDAAFAKALARDPKKRYANALEMAVAFRAAAGLADEPRPLPQLDDAVRERCLAHAPQPLAEAVAALDAARNPRQARDAVWLCAGTLARYLGVLALAARSRLGPARDAGTSAMLRKIGSGLVTDDDWLAVAQAILKGHAERPDLHPLPELVLFFTGEGAQKVRELAALHGELEDAAANDEAMRARLAKALVVLSALLRQADFVCDYPLVVPGGDGTAEQWTGVRRNRRSALALAGGSVQAGQPIVVDRAGSPVLSLFPLLQVRPPASGAANETFMYAGRSERGGKLVAPPFECHDDAPIEWIRVQLATTLDDIAQAAGDERPPYRGLEAFTADDAQLFFGRERLVDAFVNRVRVQPLLAVVGASGAGKSSFVQAGVLPALGAGWRAFVLRPGSAPMTALAARFAAVVGALGDPRQFGELVRRYAAANGPIAIVVDQLEELFTLCKSDDERTQFATAIADAARSAEDPVRVVLTLRDDFLVRAEALPALRDRLATGLQLLTIPGREDLERILAEPARRAGYEFEDPELVGRMVDAVADQPGALALLSFTAARLWELRDRHFRRLPTRAYEAIGGVGGALAKHAEALLEEMTREEQRLVREVFRNLVTSEGTRAVIARGELASVLGGGAIEPRRHSAALLAGSESRLAVAHAVIERLVASRLIVASEGDGDERIEVAHEALLDAWPRLVAWRREDADGARLRDQLRAAAKQWHDRGRPRGLLWRDDALAEYQLWQRRYPGALAAIESAFAAASVRDAARGRRFRAGVVATVMLLLAVGLVVLYRAGNRAEVASEHARDRLIDLNVEQGRQALLAKDPMRALAYLSKAYSSGARGPDLSFMIARATSDLDTQQAVLRHGGVVRDVAISSDGRIVVSGGDEGGKIWDAATGKLLHSLPHDRRVYAVAIAPDGKRVVTGSSDDTAKVWDLATGALLLRLDHRNSVSAARFSPDGKHIATACKDFVVRLWNAETGQLERELPGHSAFIVRVVFDPSGARMLSLAFDGTARVWDVATGAELVTLHHANWVVAGQFSPDGTMIATASVDRTAKLWEAATGKLLGTLQHFHPLGWVEFSPDGKRVVTAAEDARATVWDVATGEPGLTLLGHTDALIAARFSPDGKQILTHGSDGTARLWDADTGAPLVTFVGHTDIVQAAAFDPNGPRIVTGSSDGTARIWDTRSTSQLAHAEGEAGDDKDGFALDRDGNVLVSRRAGAQTVRSTSDGSVVRRLRPSDPRAVVLGSAGVLVAGSLLPDTQNADSAVVSPALDTVVVAYGVRAPELWQIAPPHRIAVLAGATKPHALAFAPDGARLATANDDGARVWNAETGALVKRMDGAIEYRHVAWSADGGRLAGAASDKTARIWDPTTGRQLAVLQGHAGQLTSVAFHPDGVLIATTSVDETARVWNSRTGTQLVAYGFLTTVGWAGFSRDGMRLMTIAIDDTNKQPPSFQIWGVDVDHRSPDELAAYVRCRVPFAFQDQRLEPAQTHCD